MNTKKQKTFELIAYFCRLYPKQSTIVIICLLLSGIAEMLGIGALLPLITTVIGGEVDQDNTLSNLVTNFYSSINIDPTLFNLLALIVIAIIVKSLVIFQAMRYVSYVSADVARDLRMQLIQGLMKAKWPYFSSLPLGKISNIISSEAARAGHFYMLSGRSAAAFIQALVYIVAAFVVSWQVSLVAIVMGGFVAFILKRFIRMARQAGSDMTNASNSMLTRLNESLSGVKPLKAMGQEKNYIYHLEKDTTSVMKAQKKQSLSSLFLQIVYEPTAITILATGLFYILTYTSTPVTSVILLAFLFYRLLSQVNQLQIFYQNMVKNETAVDVVTKEIEAAIKAQETLTIGAEPSLNSSITFDKLTISYDKNNPIFKEFSERVPANKFTVIFGPSGIGKTTLVDALLNLIPVDSGSVSIDNQKLTDIDIKKWRDLVGYVPQDTFLFHDTVEQNVTLGDESFSKELVVQSLKAAGAWKFVDELSEGIETIVGERGGKLSGGQRQRIALARALIRQPKILILDEATTGLDKESEAKVFESIDKLSGKVTIIAISHDLSIIERADHVIRIKEEAVLAN